MNITTQKYHKDTIGILNDGIVVALIQRMANNSWGLFDQNDKRITKITFSKPKDALSAYKRRVSGNLNETTWTVTLTRMLGTRPDSITRDNIQAATQAEAVQKAQQGIPNASAYTQITANQVDPNGNPMVPDDQSDQNNPPQGNPQQGMANPMSGSAYNPMQQESLKRLVFPYQMNLPTHYERLIAEARIPALKIERRNGRIMIIVPKPEDLELFVKKLLETKNDKSMNLVEGIMDSARHV